MMVSRITAAIGIFVIARNCFHKSIEPIVDTVELRVLPKERSSIILVVAKKLNRAISVF